ncbi:MAG: Ig-like domain-containing protein, partial [Gemmatimonadaceae bacterium]
MSRKIRVARLSTIAFLAGLLALGCSSSDSVAPPAPVASILFSATVDSVVLGRAYQLSATTQDAQHHALSGHTVVWTVRDTAVASVSTSGTVMGLQLGTTQVMAQSEGVTASLTLNVVRVPVARVQFAVASQMLNVGDSLPVGAIVSDASGAALTDRSVTYVSTGPTVVSVTPDGLLRGIAPGTATVTATTGGVSGQLSVQVRSLPVAR